MHRPFTIPYLDLVKMESLENKPLNPYVNNRLENEIFLKFLN